MHIPTTFLLHDCQSVSHDVIFTFFKNFFTIFGLWIWYFWCASLCIFCYYFYICAKKPSTLLEGLNTPLPPHLLHAGEPLLTLQSGGRRHLQAAEGVQRQRVQEQALSWALQPGGGALLLQHGLRVRVGARGRDGDRDGGAGRARGAGGARGVTRTVLRGEHASVAGAAVSDLHAVASLGVQLPLHLHSNTQGGGF